MGERGRRCSMMYIYMHMNTNDVYIRVGVVAGVLTTTT